MDYKEFFSKMNNETKQIECEFTNKQIEQFYKYMKMLIEWNEKINLTAIIEPEEIIKKHFVDSLTILKYIKDENTTMIDVGTGAGFPGIPIKIAQEKLKITLLDSLNKRINFLNNVKDELNLSNLELIHLRIEDVAHNDNYREKYDIATSRAVANMPVLLEYLLPMIKIGGKCICMKGGNIEQEIENSKRALNVLGGKIKKIDEFNLPNSDIKRSIIIVEKVSKTPEKYPRRAGIPVKEPLI